MPPETKPAARRWTALRGIATGGLAAATLDMLFASVFWALRGVPVIRIPQSVAAGLLGRDAFAGGTPVAALGLLLHAGIALTMAACYVVVSRRWRWLVDAPLRAGTAYGLLLWGVMNGIVVPLSAAPRGANGDTLWVGLSVVAHVVLVAFPIAWAARRSAGATPGPVAAVRLSARRPAP